MELDQQQLQQLVAEVVTRLTEDESSCDEQMFQSVDAAVEAAVRAQQRLTALSLTQRQRLVKAMRKLIKREATAWAEQAVAETGIGNVADKVTKLKLVAAGTPGLTDLTASARTGDDGLTLNEYSAFGVIAALTPRTNAIETIACNALGMIAAGNAVVFCPHSAAAAVSARIVGCLNETIVAAGGLPHLLSVVKTPGAEQAKALMQHRGIDMVVATGAASLADEALRCGKKSIATGAAHAPVIVDGTADIAQTARHLVAGASFDNNLSCIAEKVIIAVDGVTDFLLHHLTIAGAQVISDDDMQQRLEALLLDDQGMPNCRYKGQDAGTIMQALGVYEFALNGGVVPNGISHHDKSKVRLLVQETSADHPYVRHDLMMPVLPLVRVPDINTAIELAREVEQGNRHTAIMHSKHIDHLTACARALQTVMFVKNAPSYAAFGMCGEGFTSFTIAARTGEGPTSARHFSRMRRCVLSDGFLIK